MIELKRNRTKAAVRSSFRGKTPRNRLVKLMKEVRARKAAGEEVKLKFPSKWSETKEQLLIESHGKCAYCETPTEVVAFGDVEHYRPKSVYWWLAYVYDNYLASCSVCNQRFKSNKFERDGPMMQAPPVMATTTDAELEELASTAIPDPLDAAQVSAFEEAHRAEVPLIPNPYVDHPEGIFAWDVLEGAEEVEVVAKDSVPLAEEMVDASDRIYGLNRPQLKRLRFKHWRFYENFRTFADRDDVPGDLRETSREMIDSLKQADSQYAAMIRFFEST